MKEAHSIRVLIVDDHPVIRNGLRYSLLACNDIQVTGEAGSGEEALMVCNGTQPDVVLMDLLMPGMDGETTTKAIKTCHPHVQVIALTSFQHKELMKKVMEAGASGCLFKDIAIDELAAAIRTAYAGWTIPPPVAAQMPVELADDPAGPGQELTEHQLETLALVAEGLSNEEIARRLGISLPIARRQVSRILTKLGTSNRAEAAALALEYNLVKK